MELGLSLGLNLNTTLSIGPSLSEKSCDHRRQEEEEEAEEAVLVKKEKESHSNITDQDHEATNKLFPIVSLSPKADHKNNNNSLQLDLLPLSSSFPWPPPSENGDDVAASSRVLKVSGLPEPAAGEEEEEEEERAALSSSPNSGTSSFQMDLSIYSRRRERGSSMSMSMSASGNNNNNNINGGEASYYDQRASSRASDEDDNVGGGSTRKKLRLSKEQSAFLEESFKEHSTLNPKQKLALAKQLNLRPRQVEVWFQNRRARTKLKQTEVDCEYLKRCCETLSEENKRLQKELQELRALKASTSNPFFMQLPATTLTMCPSCERVTPNNPTSSSSTPPSTTTGGGGAGAAASKAIGFPFGRPKFYPFAHSKPHQ